MTQTIRLTAAEIADRVSYLTLRMHNEKNPTRRASVKQELDALVNRVGAVLGSRRLLDDLDIANSTMLKIFEQVCYGEDSGCSEKNMVLSYEYLQWALKKRTIMRTIDKQLNEPEVI